MGHDRQLESVLIEMIVATSDFPTSSFEAVVSASAAKTEGNILFNVRVDGRADVQRVAEIASKSAKSTTLLLLDRSGTSIQVCDVPAESASALTSVLIWANQPLARQAATGGSIEVFSLLETVLGPRHQDC